MNNPAFRKEVQLLDAAIEHMGVVQAIEYLDSLLPASNETKRPAIIFVRDRLQHQLQQWAQLQARTYRLTTA